MNIKSINLGENNQLVACYFSYSAKRLFISGTASVVEIAPGVLNSSSSNPTSDFNASSVTLKIRKFVQVVSGVATEFRKNKAKVKSKPHDSKLCFC